MIEGALKSGWKSSEFWLTIAAWIVGLLLDSGLLGQGLATKGLGMVAASLATMGYQYTRGKLKEVVESGKPGFKTSEFWLTIAAWIVGSLIDSGFLVDGSPALNGIGMLSAAMTQMGYSYARVKAKLPASEV